MHGTCSHHKEFCTVVLTCLLHHLKCRLIQIEPIHWDLQQFRVLKTFKWLFNGFELSRCSAFCGLGQSSSVACVLLFYYIDKCVLLGKARATSQLAFMLLEFRNPCFFHIINISSNNYEFLRSNIKNFKKSLLFPSLLQTIFSLTFPSIFPVFQSLCYL